MRNRLFSKTSVWSVILVVPGLGCGWTLEGLAVLLGGPTAERKITARRRGCSEFSRSVELSAEPVAPGSRHEWFFTNGTSRIGATVVHTFEEEGPQQVTLIVGGEIISTRVSVPVRGDPSPGPDPFEDDCIENQGALHVSEGTDVDYRNDPPASGPHYSGQGIAPIAAGFYENPVPPQVWVHNLEHGYIVILFDCPGDCPSDLLDNLRQFFSSVQHKLIITRYPGLSSPIVAVAWDVQRQFDSFDADELRAFHDRRVDQSPEGGFP